MKPARIIFSITLLGFEWLLIGCQAVGLPGLAENPASEIQQAVTPASAFSFEEILVTPTPQPTATPGVISKSVAEISAATGLNLQMFLGLTLEDWVNLMISLLIFVFGSLIISRIVRFVINTIVKSTPGQRDDEFFTAIRKQIDLLIGVLVLNYATNRLSFISVIWKENLNQIFYAVFVIAIAAMFWKLIDLYLLWHQTKAVPQGQVDHNASLRYLFKRFMRALVVIAAATIILNNYGINITLILAALGAIVVALLIAAQDLLSDMLYGFILLFSKPFGVGDRVEIKELNTWGDVVEIGVRATRVRTSDNRLVVYPNSIIGSSQVINYSQPDVLLRIQIDFNVAFGEEPEGIETVIVEAVRQVEGVAADKPIDVLLMNVSKSGLTFQLRWWLLDYKAARYSVDSVLRAVYAAMLGSEIEMSLESYDLNLFMQSSKAHLDTSAVDASEE